jgi:hypothetical protein
MPDSHDHIPTASGERVALTNVRVFDGRELRPLSTVVIDGAGHGGLAAIHGRRAAQHDRHSRHSQRRHPRDDLGQ